jgi:hypothetical protein
MKLGAVELDGLAVCYICPDWKVQCEGIGQGERCLHNHLHVIHDRGLMVSREQVFKKGGKELIRNTYHGPNVPPADSRARRVFNGG